jgi:hypothetical protein
MRRLILAGVLAVLPTSVFAQSNVNITRARTVEAALATVDTHVDGIEGLIAITNSTIFAEDAASTSGDHGVVVLAVRHDANGTLVGTDGDYGVPQLDSAGNLKIACLVGCSTSGYVTEDTPESSGVTGPVLMSVRRDTAASSANTTNDYATINTDANGLLWVRCGSGCSGGVQYAEDAAHVSGDSVTVMGGIRRDTTPTSSAGTAGDYAVPNIDANGRLYTQSVLYDSTGVELTTSQDATHGATVIGTGPQQLLEAKDFDGAALPNTVSEGQAVRQAGSQYGIAYVMPVSEDGSDSTFIGNSTYYAKSAGSSQDEHQVKASAGRLFTVDVTNADDVDVFWRCYNLTSASTTPGSSTVFRASLVPAHGGLTLNYGPNGIAFSTALTCTFTTGEADTDTASVTANKVRANYGYK